VLPVINTGIAHKRAGIGQIGAGVTKGPMKVFAAGIAAFGEKYLSQGGTAPAQQKRSYSTMGYGRRLGMNYSSGVGSAKMIGGAVRLLKRKI